MSHWHYQIMRSVDDNGEEYLGYTSSMSCMTRARAGRQRLC